VEDKLLLTIDLSVASELLIELLMEDAIDPSVFEEIAKSNMKRPEILRLLLENPATPEDVRQQISYVLSVPVTRRAESIKTQMPDEERSQNIFQKLQKLKISEKILLALRGGKEIRTLLLRDPNKDVSLSVLENPKITEGEVEVIAKSRSIADETLRRITKKREWMKTYGIMHAIISNPRSPAGTVLPLISQLRTKDLSLLAKNRNVSEGIRNTAKKLLIARKGL
jgi:hypothetical protein